MFYPYKKSQGFTLVELMVALGLFLIVMSLASWLMIQSFRNNAIFWEQLSTQNDGRRVLQLVVDDVRKAEPSSVGSYPIVTAGDHEFTFYANIDDDTERERVRFWVTTTTMYRGVVHPTGTPFSYDGAEDIVTIARDIENIPLGTPTFSYFDQAYTGTSTPMVQPVNITDVRVVRVSLELEEDPTDVPEPLLVESTVQIRNLKEN